jgi:hypothetical protein
MTTYENFIKVLSNKQMLSRIYKYDWHNSTQKRLTFFFDTRNMTDINFIKHEIKQNFIDFNTNIKNSNMNKIKLITTIKKLNLIIEIKYLLKISYKNSLQVDLIQVG